MCIHFTWIYICSEIHAIVYIFIPVFKCKCTKNRKLCRHHIFSYIPIQIQLAQQNSVLFSVKVGVCATFILINTIIFSAQPRVSAGLCRSKTITAELQCCGGNYSRKQWTGGNYSRTAVLQWLLQQNCSVAVAITAVLQCCSGNYSSTAVAITAELQCCSGNYSSTAVVITVELQCCGGNYNSAAVLRWQLQQNCSVAVAITEELQCCGGNYSGTAVLRWQLQQYCSVAVAITAELQCCGGNYTRAAVLRWQLQQYCSAFSKHRLIQEKC